MPAAHLKPSDLLLVSSMVALVAAIGTMLLLLHRYASSPEALGPLVGEQHGGTAHAEQAVGHQHGALVAKVPGGEKIGQHTLGGGGQSTWQEAEVDQKMVEAHTAQKQPAHAPTPTAPPLTSSA